ncbi:MAG: twin-arginine translocase TatA/TatE family subunit [Betaproteobacteria bacterium]|jgi:sec-independent protein translocase protein TatA
MGISVWQVLLVVLVGILLFGAGRLPRLMGDMAKGIKSFREGMKDEINNEQPPLSKLENSEKSNQKDEKDPS